MKSPSSSSSTPTSSPVSSHSGSESSSGSTSPYLSSSPPPSHVKLMTYNLFIRPPGIRNNGDDFKDERVECLINENISPMVLKSYDSDKEGVPNKRFKVDMKKFPHIPFLSPWRSPYHHFSVTPSSSDLSMKGQEAKIYESQFTELEQGSAILSEFDIICFQELFSAFSFRQRRLVQKAKQLGFKYNATSPLPAYLRSSFLVDGGLVVLSKYPIEETDFLLYMQGVDSDMLASKGVLYTRIVLPDHHRIHLFTTHMQASYIRPNTSGSADGNSKNDNIRQYQINQLRDFILKKTYKDSYPVILAGDLNVDARPSKEDGRGDSPSYLEMLDTLSTYSPEYTDETIYKSLVFKDPTNTSRLFNISDPVKSDFNGNHPPTVGDIHYKKNKETDQLEGHPRETALTNKNDYKCMKRLDYILFFERLFNHSKADTKPAKPVTPEEHTSRIEPFFIDGFPFSQLSDHYGVSINLELH